jgi:site-specific DNA-methyltransferase (adenine-specific)
MGELATSADLVLRPQGSFFLNLGSPPSDPWFAWDVARTIAERFTLQNVLHWVKSIALDRRFIGRAARIDRDLALGHYRPVGSDRFVHGAQEYVFHFTRSGRVPIDRLAIGVPYQDPSNVARWQQASGGLRCRGNTWFLPYPTIQERARDRPHPATFPPELAEWCVRLHGLRRARHFADPFVGIGSSAVAAVRLGVAFTGFDIDRSYLEVARERVRHERVRLRSAPRSTGSASSGRYPAEAESTRASAAS